MTEKLLTVAILSLCQTSTAPFHNPHINALTTSTTCLTDKYKSKVDQSLNESKRSTPLTYQMTIDGENKPFRTKGKQSICRLLPLLMDTSKESLF